MNASVVRPGGEPPKEEMQARAFRAELARFKDGNPELVTDQADAILVERVGRAFWNASREFHLRQIARMHRVGLL